MKRSQVKFGETLAVLFIIYLIIMVGAIWYNKVHTSEIRDMYLKQQREAAFDKYNFITTLPLVHVSERGVIDNEFDVDAMAVFEEYSSTSKGQEYLRPRLGKSIITMKVYNKSSINSSGGLDLHGNYTLYNYTGNNTVLEDANWEIFRTMVPVRDRIEEEGLIGMLEVKIPIEKMK